MHYLVERDKLATLAASVSDFVNDLCFLYIRYSRQVR